METIKATINGNQEIRDKSFYVNGPPIFLAVAVDDKTGLYVYDTVSGRRVGLQCLDTSGTFDKRKEVRSIILEFIVDGRIVDHKASEYARQNRD